MKQPENYKSPHGGSVTEIGAAPMRARVARLARILAPALPVVGAATRTEEGLRAWVDAWTALATSAGLSDDEIRHGLAHLGDAPVGKPFGWDVFLLLCRPREMRDADARRELDAARSAYARREFAGLAAATWQAAAGLGFGRVFNGDGVTDAGWAAALAEARQSPDSEILGRQPAGPQQARIAVSAEARAEYRARSRCALDDALSGLPLHLRPRRLGGN